MVKNKVPTLKFPDMRPSAAERRELGELVELTVLKRIGESLNATDQEALEYSRRGPIYIPIVGNLGQHNAYGKRFTGRMGGVGYNKGAGTYVVSKRYANRTNKAIAEAFAGTGEDTGISIVSGGKTMKFEDYAAYKQFLGHSGTRDLFVTGKLFGSVEIVEETPNSVSVGFQDDEQAQIMADNDKRDQTWAFSPNDEQVIVNRFEEMIDLKLAEAFPD